MKRRVLLLTCLALAACPRRVPGPTEVLDDAAARAQAGGASARELALAGFHALAMQGDVELARSRFDQSLALDPAEPWALHGQGWVAWWHGHPDRALQAAAALCLKAPGHPLAAVGARTLFESAGQSRQADEQILEVSAQALAQGARGDVAWLLRAARAAIFANRQSPERAQAVAELGSPTEALLVGPLSPWHTLPAGERLPPEEKGQLDGAPGARVLRFADAHLSLSGESGSGDGYLFGADVTVAEGGDYLLRSVSVLDHAVVLDGAPVLQRSTWKLPASTYAVRVVHLTAGVHRLLVRAFKGGLQGHVWVSLQPADGRAPKLTFTAAKGPPPARWGPRPADEEEPPKPADSYPTAQSLAEALEPEGGPALAAMVAAADARGRDRDGVKTLLAELPKTVAAPAVLVARAEVSLEDRALPARVSRGRATRDLEQALEKDPRSVPALLAQATLAFEDARYADAMELAARARAAHAPAGAPVALLEARVALALNLDGRAEQAAAAALTAHPGDCEALALQADVARRHDALDLERRRQEALGGCPGALERRIDWLRGRGRLDEALEALRALSLGDDGRTHARQAEAQVLRSLGRTDEAKAALEALLQRWPRLASAWQTLGDVRELLDDAPGALAAREAALALDGGNLQLRRRVERARTGRELLTERAISTEEALKAYAAAPGDEDVPAAYLLDAAAVRAYPDGSQVDRIHIIQKALDQSGVADIAEVQLPQGAEVLTLRTLKADGSTLEPENIDGKETVSLPGVQVGDAVEYEYLLAHPPRGPGQPGFTASNFYFQIARQPNNWSTYTVVAPRGSGLKVDAHHVTVAPVAVEGDEEVFHHEERRVPPYLPEPESPPSGNEYLPWVSVGAGTLGNDGVVTAYADAFLEQGRLTTEVRRFAQEAAAGAQGLDAVRAVYTAVMARLAGRDAGLAVSAAASAVQDRGSRLWLLRSALAALGFEVRVAAVHTFNADPDVGRLPNESLLPYLCVRVTVPGMGEVWLDTLVRYAPFGELPELARGRDAVLFPEPGLALSKVKTPAGQRPRGKDVTLTLSLAKDGVLTGTGLEVYQGFEAAQLAEALEQLPPEQRQQALESALSRYFGGAQLTSLELGLKRAVGATVEVKYAFTAPRFARQDDDGQLVLGSLTYPALLGRRYLALSRRRTPLFLDATEASHTLVKLTLPDGYRLSSPIAEAQVPSPFGRFVRKEAQVGTQVTVDETLELPQARIAPSALEAFARFAGEVDLLQGRDVLVGPAKAP